MTVFTGTIQTVSSGETSTYPAKIDGYRDALKALTEAWTSYTPTWTGATTNPVLNNGSFSGSAYAQIGKLVIFRIVLTMGSTTTYGSGAWSITLPVAPKNAGRWSFPAVDISDTGTASYSGRMVAAGGSPAGLLLTAGTSAGGPDRLITATVPHTWANTDFLTLNGVYEAA